MSRLQVTLLVICIAISGCTHHGYIRGRDRITRDGIPSDDIALSHLSRLVEDAYRNAPLHSKTFNVLVLSSGGQFGAYGAGVINSLYESDKPTFDIVCGSSIGAIMASHAFLAHLDNSPSTKDRLKNFFVKSTRKDWYRKKGPLEILFTGNSLYSTVRLREHIKTLVTQEVFDAVRGEVTENPNRKLFVATINADQGYRQIWNMGEIAKSKGYDYYIDVLTVAAAVPLFFPAKFTDLKSFADVRRSKNYSMHIDGGVQAPLLFREVVGKIPTGDKKPYVVVIQNGYYRAAATTVDNTLKGLSVRTFKLMIAEIRESRVALIDTIVTEKLHGDFRYTHVPDDFKIKKGETGLSFNQNTMQRLYAVGTDPKWLSRAPPPAANDPYPESK